MTVKDITGTEIDLDDYLAVALADGSGSELRVGRVLKITQATFLMGWMAPEGKKAYPKYSNVYHTHRKFLKIDKPVDFPNPE